MLPTILLFSDLHLHSYTVFGLSKDGKMFKRLEDQINVLEQITNILEKRNIKMVIFGGDLLHKVNGVPIEALNVANKYFIRWRALGIKIFFVTGNHDIVDKVSPAWYQSLITLFKSDSDLPSSIRLIDYNEKINYSEIKGYDLVVIHQTPIGAALGNFTFKEGVNWAELGLQNKLVCYGHIHQKQQLSTNSFILGSPMPLTFADTNERGVYVLENGKLEFIQLTYPQFITVENSLDAKNDGNYYRVLSADKKSNDPNVVNIVKPKFFEQKLKGETFEELLNEWLALNNKETKYLEIIKDIISKQQTVRKVFKGKILGIKIKNFFSIENFTLDFPDGFVQVKGENGVGKSTIFDAIYWCLYGKTTKKLTGTDVVRDKPTQQSFAEVELYLSGANGGRGKICRSSKEGLSIYKSEDDKTSIVEGLLQDKRQEILESLLGIPEGLFLSACYFSQENLKMLTNIGDTDKTNLITDLHGFEEYEILYKECHTKQVNTKNEKQNLELTKRDLVKEIELQNTFIEQLSTQKETFVTRKLQIKDRITEYSNKIIELNETLANFKAKEIVAYDYDSELERLSKEKQTILETIKLIENQRKEVSDKKQALLLELTGFNSLIATNIKETNKLVKEVEEIKVLSVNSSCSHCGSVITEGNKQKHIDEKTLLVSSLLLENSDYSSKVDVLKQKIQELNVKLVELGNVPSVENIDNKIALNNILKHQQSEELRLEQNKEANIKVSINEAITNKTKEEENFVNIDSTIMLQDRSILENTVKKGIAEEKLSILFENILQKDIEVEQLEFWKTAFSAKGIKSLLLSKFCNEFNLIVNEYVALISNGAMNIILSPTKTIKSKEERNELSFDILIGENERKYQSLSGGQKRRIDISLCLALNKWVSNRYNLKYGLLGILILDELFSYLDSGGEETIANVLQEEGKNKSIFVVSHTSSLEAYAKLIWNIYTTENGVAGINYISN